MNVPGMAGIVAAYLIGAIPFGYIAFKSTRGKDIRSVGSGNIGATNVSRSAGWSLGGLTLLLDVLKGAAAVLLTWSLTGDRGDWAAAAALAAVAGHCFPVYLRFRGGKGVATGLGTFLLLDAPAMGIAVAGFALVLGASRMVALASITASLIFPLAAWALGGGVTTTLFAGLASLVIVLRHHENIRRILRGEEGRMWGPGSKEKL